MASARLSRGPRERTFGDAGSVPAKLERDCRIAADDFIDRDAESLAHRSGLSARVINHQRERHDDRKSAVETVSRMLYGALDLGWPFDRRLQLVRPILDALCADAVPRAARGDARGVLITAANATVEASQGVAAAIAAVADGQITPTELAEIEREIQEAIESLHRLRREAEAAAGVASPAAAGAFHGDDASAS